MAKTPQTLFQRLTRLFRSGPIVKRKIRALDTIGASVDNTKSSGALLFQKSLSPAYASITSNAYNLSERLMRYQDFIEMEYTPEIASALDIYADETASQDEKGRILQIFSENEKIKQILEDLFYNTLNVEFNIRPWVRNLCKYGDFFLFNDVSPEHGVINAFPIAVNEIEREENFDRDDPFAVRYRWITLGNRVLENWEISHFRLLGNDMFLPYGSSIIEPARRIWRQLILIEDAMLVYRIVRAPERRVFYIDVANMPAAEVAPYIEAQRKTLRTAQVIDNTTGRVDLRYNPLSADEDYFLPVRGSESGTKIDTLAGGQNTAAVEDVAYIQKKLFAALKVPRAYLGYDEALSSKSTLAQEDIRFSRTISVIQKTMLAELNKLAIIHLYANGYNEDDLQNFTLRLSNPSTIAQQQKLELWRTKFEVGGSLPADMGSAEFVQKEIWGLSDDQIDEINRQRTKEVLFKMKLESLSAVDDAAGGDAGGGDDLFGDDTSADEPDAVAEPDADATPPEENAGEEPEEDQQGLSLLTASDNVSDEEFDLHLQAKLKPKTSSPIKPQSQLKRALYNQSRKRTHGASKTSMPDFETMMSHNSKSLNDPFDQNWSKSLISNPFGESVNTKKQRIHNGFTPDVWSTLNKMTIHMNLQNKASNNSMLNEDVNFEEDDDESLYEDEK